MRARLIMIAVFLAMTACKAWSQETSITLLVEAGKPNCTPVIAGRPEFMEERALVRLRKCKPSKDLIYLRNCAIVRPNVIMNG